MKRKETIHRRKRIEIGCLRTFIHGGYFSNLPVTKITSKLRCSFKCCLNHSITKMHKENKIIKEKK